MGKNNRNKTPYIREVERVELDEKRIKPRAVFAVIFLAIAVWMITYGVISLLSTEPGWREIEASAELEGNCGPEIIFQYNIGASGVSAGTEYRKITELYNEAVVKATKIFYNRYFYDVNNLYTLNQSPNSEQLIEPELYSALKLLSDFGRREMYFAPYYAEYNSLFFCVDDSEAYNFDPAINPEMSAYFAAVQEFVTDESHVNLEFLGENRVILRVSDAYLAFAEENYITSFVDLYWMKNAFIVDYLADTLERNGYTFGSLSSFDGFVRNLDEVSGAVYAYNIFDREESVIYPAAQMNYTGKISLCSFRNYAMVDLDVQFYYEYENGEIRHRYIGSDGYPVSANDSLVTYSSEKSCAEVMAESLSVYLTDDFDEDALKLLHEDGVSYVYCDDFKLYSDGDSVNFSELFNNGGIKYTLCEE